MKLRVIGAASVLAVVGGLAAVSASGMQDGQKKPSPAAAVAGGSFKIDNSHTSVIYRIKHLGVSNFYGRFDKISGDFKWDGSKPEATTLSVTIDTESINSNNEGRDKHLKGPDFFNTKQFPKIEFKAKSLAKAGAGWELTGDLTMLGKTKEIKAAFTPTGEKDVGPQMGGYRAGFESTFTVKRSDFGMSWGVENGALGDEVTLMVSVEGIRQ